VAQVQSHFSLLPAPLLTLSARRVDPDGKMWNRLRAALAQPHFQEPPTAPDGTSEWPGVF
jgi:6-phosphofructokinase 1